MSIRITGKRSVYLEIAEEYKRFIRLGVLSDGDKLPSVRALAVELGINPNTVERARTWITAPKAASPFCRRQGNAWKNCAIRA